MAGIGFRLKELLKNTDSIGMIKGCLYSLIISSGPWIITIISIALISTLAQENLNNHKLLILKSIISYTFAFTLVLFGIIEMPITRYIADKLYLNDTSNFRSLYFFLIIFFTVFGSIISYLFYYTVAFSALVKIACAIFFVSVMAVWIGMVFLSAAKEFSHIVWSFFFGSIATVTLSSSLGFKYGLSGNIIGLALGQLILASFLASRIILEFQNETDLLNFEFVTYFSKHKKLVFIGLFYYLGIWIDKIIFWFVDYSIHVEGLFYTNPFYDTAMFLGYLSIVPAFAIFVVIMETDFYQEYKYLFKLIDDRSSLNIIENATNRIIISIKRATIPLLKIQTFTTVICLIFSDQIIEYMHLSTMTNTTFRYSIIGGYVQVLFLFCNIILLYFECYKEVLIDYGIFFISNLIFSLVTFNLSFQYHGIGYIASVLLTFIISIVNLNNKLFNINLLVFMSQPLKRDIISENME